MIALIVLGLVAAIVLMRATVVLKGSERGVIFRLGRPVAVVGPGIALVIPFIDRMTRVSVAEQQIRIPAIEATTSDQQSTTLSARLSYRILDPMRATLEVTDLRPAIQSLLENSLRGLAGETEYDRLTSNLGEAAAEATRRLDSVATSWGVKILSVDLDRQRF